MPRQERERERRDAHRQRQEHGVDGLRDVQAGCALDVAQHPAPLRHHLGQRLEVRVEEHQLRDRTRGVAPRPHRDAEIRILQRERVVDAVAGHGDGVAARPQRVDHRALLLGGDASEHRPLLHSFGERRLVLGQFAGVDRMVGSLQPELPGDRAHRARIVSRDHLDRDVLLTEVRERLRRVRSKRVLQHHEGDGPERVRQPAVLRQPVGARQDQHPRPLRRRVRDAGARGTVAVDQHVGAPDEPGALIRERNRTPFPRGGERHRGRLRPTDRGRRVSLRDRGHRRVGMFVGGCDGRERRLEPIISVERLDGDDRELAGGERSGLVDAQHVDPREPLDGR